VNKDEYNDDPNADFNVTPLSDAEYLKKTVRDIEIPLQWDANRDTCPTQKRHFECLLSDLECMI